METVSAKVPDDLAEEIEDYRERYGLNRSQAVRRLVEDGLEADRLRDDLEERRQHAERTIAVTKPAAVSLIGWFMIAFSITAEPAARLAAAGALVIVGSAVYAVYRGHQ